MKGVFYRRFGGLDVLELGALPDPRPGPGELLVRVRAAALNPKDLIVRSGRFPGFRLLAGPRFPKQLGYDWAGEVVDVGAGVRGVSVGERRFGMIQAIGGGALAALACVKPSECALHPTSVAFTEAAALPLAGLTALQALRDVAGLTQGMRVLVNGASGGVGSLAVQVAKILGAHVTTLTSGASRTLARELGADLTLDRTSTPMDALDGRFDVVLDAFGNHTFDALRPRLTPRGTYVQTVPSRRIATDTLRTLGRGPRARLVVVRSNADDLALLRGWVDAGRLRPVIDRVLPLDEVREAFAHLATKRARGKVVLDLA